MRRSGRIPDRVLADLLGRLAVAIGAGIDPRRAWAVESARVPRAWRGPMASVAAGLADGAGLADALDRAGDAFPLVVRGTIRAGDRAGRDAETLRDVAAALAETVRARREFVASLVGPAVRLAAALAVVGVLIGVSAAARTVDGRPVDVLGLGLSGTRGLLGYCGLLVGIAALAAASGPRALQSWRERGVVRSVANRLPLLGPALRASEAASWCRAAALAGHAGLDPGSLVALASLAAPGLAIDVERLGSRLRRGAGFDEALRAANVLPEQIVAEVALGESTGMLPEMLERLARRYGQESREGFMAAARAVEWAAWAAVAGLVAVLAWRVMTVYVGMIEDAARPL
jgi:type II secretory pathway component PulF